MAALLQQVLLLLALTPTKQLVATLKAPPSITPPQAGKPSIYHRAPTPYEVPESALATLEAEGLCVVDNWAPQADVQALRRDVDQLWDAGKFIASKVGSRSVSADGSITDSKTLEEETRRAQTAWLRPPPDPSVGDVDARRKLDGQLESLREKLIENSGAPLLRTMELSYAKYPVGGYYRRHIDVPRSVYYMLGRNGATDYSLQERRECPCGNRSPGVLSHRRNVVPMTASARWRKASTLSTRRCPRDCICTMAWRFKKV